MISHFLLYRITKIYFSYCIGNTALKIKPINTLKNFNYSFFIRTKSSFFQLLRCLISLMSLSSYINSLVRHVCKSVLIIKLITISNELKFRIKQLWNVSAGFSTSTLLITAARKLILLQVTSYCRILFE